MGMEQEDKWTRFAASGRIQDYLDYRKMENGTGTGERAAYHSAEAGRGGSQQQEQREKNGIVW